MKNSKKGISLIVLIITIIVIVILATAILVSVINNNPISEANKARYENDRDNTQAVFTNTIGKIMAENLGVVNVKAGQINTVSKDVKEATGEVAYTVGDATVAVNASGKIIFDKGTNDATTYYTGKKLPIYAAGETKWYVDSEGILSLEVAGVKYGTGKVEEGLTVGDYVNYTPDKGIYKVANGYWGLGLDYTTTEENAGHTIFETETDLNWRILSIDETTSKVELIADRQSTTKITFQCETGYNHGVDILHDMCNALYSKTVNGKKVAEGRSVNVEDINKKTTYDYTKYENYGVVKTPTNKHYPRLYAKELGSTTNGLNETEKLFTDSERANIGVQNENGVMEYKTYVGYTIVPTLYATWTYYSYDTEQYLNKNLGINTAPSGLIKTGTGYWLASRTVNVNDETARWSLRCINDAGLVGYWHQFNSTANGFYSLDRPYRPVVTVDLNDVLFKNANKKVDGFDSWNLEF